MDGTFVILNNGVLETYNKFENIPQSFDDVIKFEPKAPPPPHTKEDVIRNATFSETINILTDGETIHSVIVFPVPINITEIIAEDGNIVTTESLNNIVTESSFTTLTTGVTISSTNSTITFSGSYENAYDKDIIQSIPVGQSDKTIKPTISKTFELVPTGHTIFSAIQDDRPLRTAAYQVNIEYGPYKSTFSTTITQVVETDVDIFQTKLKELYP